MTPKSIRSILLFWSISLVILGAFGYFLNWPQKTRKQVLSDTIDKQVQELSYLRQQSVEHVRTQIKDEVENLKEQYDDLFFSEENIVSLEFQMQELAQQYNLENFYSRKSGGQFKQSFPKIKNIDERRFSITFESDFENILKYINKLERNNPMIFVDKLDIHIDHDRQEKPEAELGLAVMYQIL